MNLLKLKRGSGHIEIILSFILFVGFVSFLFYIFNPFQNTTESDFTDNVFLKMEENVSTDLSSVSLKVDNSVSLSNCFYINEPGIISGLKCSPDRNILVKDKNGNLLDAEIDADNIKIEVSGLPDNDDKRFYTLYCSDEIESNILSGTCTQIFADDYNIGIINNREYWSTKKLDEFNDSYHNNYNELKSSIIPEGNDFNFVIYVFGGAKVYDGEKNPPQKIKVNSKSYPIDIIDEKANVIKHTNTIIVW